MLLIIPIGILLLFPFLFFFLSEERIKKVRYILSLPLVMNVIIGGFLYQSLSTDTITVTFQWLPALNIVSSFTADWFTWYFFMLVNGIGLLIFLYASAYMKPYDGYKRFFSFLYLFTAAMNGIILAGDLITLFIFWELTSICSFLLIGFDYHQLSSRKAALTSLLITAAGGLALITACVWLGSLTGTYDIQAITSMAVDGNDKAIITIFVLLILAAFTKSAQFPFHFWLPGAMQAPTPVSAFLHSATMVKAGIYLLVRFSSFFGEAEYWSYTLSIAGAVTMILGSFTALFHADLKKILAYTTISALGTIVMLIGIDTTIAMKAALVFLLVHALYKATLFMITGVIDKLKGTRDIRQISNLWHNYPVLCIVAILSLLSMAGLPPMLGFISKEVIYDAKFHAPDIIRFMLIVSILSNAFMFYISVKLIVLLFLPREIPAFKAIKKAKWDMLAGPAILTVIAFYLGILPYSLNDLFGNMLTQLTGEPVNIKFKLWHGFNTVLMFSIITVGIGGIIWIFERYLVKMLEKIYHKIFRVNLAELFHHLIQQFLFFTKNQTNTIQHGFHRYYLMVIFVFMTLLIGYKLLLDGIYIPQFDSTNVSMLTIVVSVIMVFITVLIVTTRSRLVAVIALGLIGYGIALFFMAYGAIDLAITQIVADTLTMIIFVIVLQKLPRFSLLSSVKSRVRDAIIALSVGTSITLLILKANLINIHHPISEYFIENSFTKGKGQNIVNVILVDFRSLDTLGEITVLATAAIGIATLLNFTIKKEGQK